MHNFYILLSFTVALYVHEFFLMLYQDFFWSQDKFENYFSSRAELTGNKWW